MHGIGNSTASPESACVCRSPYLLPADPVAAQSLFRFRTRHHRRRPCGGGRAASSPRAQGAGGAVRGGEGHGGAASTEHGEKSKKKQQQQVGGIHERSEQTSGAERSQPGLQLAVVAMD